jgi:hypothetical protein
MTAITQDAIPLTTRSRFRAALALAIAADAAQIFLFPLFAEGALSAADDVLDVGVGAAGWLYKGRSQEKHFASDWSFSRLPAPVAEQGFLAVRSSRA